MLPGETILSGAPDHDENPDASEFQLLRSAAGWCVGTVICEDGVTFPNTRETGYIPSEAEAERALLSFQMTGIMPGATVVRDRLRRPGDGGLGFHPPRRPPPAVAPARGRKRDATADSC